MTIENVCRINVWATMAAARAAFDGADGSELIGRMIVWPTTKLAKEYYTENAGEGGGGTTPWVPADAKVHIDFLGGTPQGRAWVDGTGEVVISTLLGTDANTANGWAPTLYNPAFIGADGYLIAGSNPPAFIGVARTLITSVGGFTMRVQIKHVNISGGQGTTPFTMMSADGSDGISVDFTDTTRRLRGSSSNGPLMVIIESCTNLGLGVRNACAFTMAGSRYEESGNGFAAATGVIGATDRPPGNPLVAALIDTTQAAAIQSITLYDPLPTTTGLSTLSAIT